MRKISGLAAMAVVAVSGTYAQADSAIDGTFTFRENPAFEYPLPTGSFVWDSTTSTWKSFTVDWDGAVFNFAKVFPDPAALATAAFWCGVAPGTKDCAAPGHFFLYKESFNTTPEQPTWTDLTAFAYGTYTVKETTTTTTTATTTPTTGARNCGRARGRPHSDGDDGHDCGRGRGGPHSDGDDDDLQLRTADGEFRPHRKGLRTATTAVPEPATLGLMALGLLGAGFAGRKRRN